MGNFRPGASRGGFGNRGGSRSNFGNRGGFGRDRDSDSGGRGGFSRGGNRGSTQMFEATCSKCGKRCELPFRPRGDKPVFCSDCFKQQDGNDRSNSGSNRTSQSGSGITAEQFNQLNMKLDRILLVLKDLEIDTDDEEEELEELEEELDENDNSKEELVVSDADSDEDDDSDDDSDN